jgi:hypothetical protein
MRRKNREINIFSISMMDVLASALGVFILIAVVLFPYYMKNAVAVQARHQAEAQARAQAERAEEAEAQARAQGKRAEEAEAHARAQVRRAKDAESQARTQAGRAEDAERKRQEAEADAKEQARQADRLRRETHLQVAITWAWPKSGDRDIETKDDVDLFLVDPAGNLFDYRNRIRPGVPGAFLVDSMHTPGGEIWSAERADPGIYTVCIVRQRVDRHQSLPVKGLVAYRDGRIALPDMNLDSSIEGRHMPMAAIQVSDDGEVTVHQVRQASFFTADGCGGGDRLISVEIPGLSETGQCPCFHLGPGKHTQ